MAHESAEGSRRPLGRRRGESSTRAAILDAARRQFASGGFAGTTLRSVAAEVGVDAALVVHFFRSKDGLFAAALDLPGDLASRVIRSAVGDAESAAHGLVSTYLSLWEDPATAAPLMAMFRSAATNDQAAGLVREFLTSRLSDDRGSLPRSPETLALAAAQLLGVAVARYMVRTEPLATMPLDEVVRRVSRTITALFEADS